MHLLTLYTPFVGTSNRLTVLTPGLLPQARQVNRSRLEPFKRLVRLLRGHVSARLKLPAEPCLHFSDKNPEWSYFTNTPPASLLV